MEIKDLTELTNTIVTHITDGNEVEGKVVEVMGGVVLELESDRLIKKGREIGFRLGEERGKKHGELTMLYSLYDDKLISLDVAVAKSGKSEKEFLKGFREARESRYN